MPGEFIHPRVNGVPVTTFDEHFTSQLLLGDQQKQINQLEDRLRESRDKISLIENSDKEKKTPTWVKVAVPVTGALAVGAIGTALVEGHRSQSQKSLTA